MHAADWERLARFLAGEGTADVRRATAAWIAADPERAAHARAAAAAWESAAPARDEWAADDAARAWAVLEARIADDAASAPDAGELRLVAAREVGAHEVGARSVAHDYSARPRSAGRRPWAAATRAARLRVAAGVLAACGAGGAAAWRVSSGRSEGWATWPWTRAPAERVYVTAPGQRATVLLADGTRVELGVASTLRVRRPRAATGPREVDLAGDAVFTVVHDARRPFRVRAGNAVAEDLGTVFGVRAYPDEPRVRVVVVAGVVALRAAAAGPGGVDPAMRTAVLHADDVGVLDAAGTTVTTRVPDAASLLGWTAGRITVRDARLDEVARELGRWFDTSVRVPDPAVAARRLTLDLPARSLDAVLDAVAVLGDVRIRRTPGGVLLVPAAAPAPAPSP